VWREASGAGCSHSESLGKHSLPLFVALGAAVDV
jgi:hypothetical protein